MAVVIKTPLEVALGDLLTAVVTVHTNRFKIQLKRLFKTLKGIQPILKDGKLLSEVFDRWEEETIEFIRYIEGGKEVVQNCSIIKFWNVHQNLVCSKKLIQLDKELLRFFHTELGNNKLMNTEDVISPIGISSTHARSNIGSCSVPRLPNNIVGFDRHLEELKCRLLTDDRQVLLISAPAGFGKTTLAKMLCHDKKIKDIFGKNILYVTISKPTSLTLVAQKLFQHFGENHPEFQTEKEASNEMEDLMRRHMGSNDMLLVLDHEGSGSIIDSLGFQIPGLKMLLTSRSSLGYANNYGLELLNEEDARILFCNSAFPKEGIQINVPDDLVNQIVNLCKGLPLALVVAGTSLCGQPLLQWKIAFKVWFDHSSDDLTYSSMLLSLKSDIDKLDEFPIVKEFFLDISSFPGYIRIAATILMDMQAELYNLDNEYMFSVDNLLKLSSRNLIRLPPIRKEAGEVKGCFNELYVTQRDLVRQLAIHLSIQKPFEERKRLLIEIHENQFPTWWVEQTVQPLNTQILSISTDETFDSIWYDLIAPKAQVLTFNMRSENYTLPQFLEKMDQLKVLSIMSHGFYHSQLHNLAVIGFLSNLKRIRFEYISFSSSIQPVFALQNLCKLSFVMCDFGDDALMSFTTDMPSNLTELEIDQCYDFKELPSELCNIVQLKKLSITNCHQLNVLPKELGSLSNLENLRLRGCTKLQELPKSIGSLNKLGHSDISACFNIRVLPEEMGELCGLKVLKMSGCRGLQKLPMSMSKLRQLKDVICDKQTLHLWTDLRGGLYRLNIHVEDMFEEDGMEITHNHPAPSIGDMVHENQQSQTAGSELSYYAAPSYSDVAPREGSLC